MIRFGHMTWQTSARLVALASWALAVALTGGMGWQAWTAIQETTPARYDSARIDTIMVDPAHIAPAQTDPSNLVPPGLSAAEIIAHKNRVAR